jgi:carbamate kinase
MKTVVIAIGGNSLIKDAQHMSVPDQYAAVVETPAISRTSWSWDTGLL